MRYLFLFLLLLSLPARADDDPERDLDPSVIDSIVMLDVLADLEDLWDGTTADRLARAAQSIPRLGNHTGLCVYDLTTDSLLYAYRATEAYKPASNEKLLTAVAALETLGADNELVARLLTRMMKRSDNQYAELMFRRLPAPAHTVRRIVAEAEGDTAQLIIADGSGLSHQNRVTPLTLVHLLRYAHARPEVFHALYASLPIAGRDGTLASRMRGTAAEGNVRAKTGTIRGVSTLSGYVTAPNGHLLCFSVMNNNVASPVAGRAFQNTICRILAQ